MLRQTILGTAAALLTAGAALAAPQILAPPVAPAASVQPYVRFAAKTVVLRYVRVVDGTGAPAQEDRTVVVTDGRIAAVGGLDLDIPAGAEVLNLPGRTVLPGLVGMHDHMYYIARPNMDAAGHS